MAVESESRMSGIKENTPLEESVIDILKKYRLSLSTAESCTGGLLSGRIVNVSGVSEVFKAGLVTYSNEAKEAFLGVKKVTLESYGAVSEETAREMAEGGAQKMNTDICVSITGIAGPDGGTIEKPVGLVYIGISSQKNTYAIKALLGEQGYNRENIRKIATDLALFCVIFFSTTF